MEADAKRLKDAIELALPYFGSGPTSSAYGQVVEDCALAHIDYFGGVSEAASHLIGALSEITGEEPAAIHKRLMRDTEPCDCKSCAGGERADAARQERQRRILASLLPSLRAAIVTPELERLATEFDDEEPMWHWRYADRLRERAAEIREGEDG